MGVVGSDTPSLVAKKQHMKLKNLLTQQSIGVLLSLWVCGVASAQTAASSPLPAVNAAPSAPVAAASAEAAAAVLALEPLKNPPSLSDNPAFWVDRVKARAQLRWNLIATKEFDKSYELLSAASQAFVSKALYNSQLTSNRFQSATIEAAECQSQSCSISMIAMMELNIPKVGSRTVPIVQREIWIVEKGDAWLLRQ